MRVSGFVSRLFGESGGLRKMRRHPLLRCCWVVWIGGVDVVLVR